jgi:hypothetical protein
MSGGVLSAHLRGGEREEERERREEAILESEEARDRVVPHIIRKVRSVVA